MIMYRINTEIAARMYTSTRMTGGMEMSTTIVTSACLNLRHTRSDHEYFSSIAAKQPI